MTNSYPKERLIRCKPASVPSKDGGNHLSLRPEPGTDCAASNGIAPYLVLLREEFTSRKSLTAFPGGLLLRRFTLTRFRAVYFLLHWSCCGCIGRNIPLFKGTPCSVQSGLSSAPPESVPRLPADNSFQVFNISHCSPLYK